MNCFSLRWRKLEAIPVLSHAEKAEPALVEPPTPAVMERKGKAPAESVGSTMGATTMSERSVWATGLYIPWPLMKWLHEHWPRVFHLLRFRTWNINSARHWDVAWSQHGEGEFRASGELKSIRERILDFTPPGSAVLDGGCEVGELLRSPKDARACHCFGVDISDPAGNAVRSVRGEEYRPG